MSTVTKARRGPGSVSVTSSVVELGGCVAPPPPPPAVTQPAAHAADERATVLAPAPLIWTSDATSAAAARIERLRLLQRKLDTLASGRLPDATVGGGDSGPRLAPPPLFFTGAPVMLPPEAPVAPLRSVAAGAPSTSSAPQADALLEDLNGRISRLEGLLPPSDAAAASADATASKLMKTLLDPAGSDGLGTPHAVATAAGAAFPYGAVVRGLRDAMLLALEPRISSEHSARLRLATTHVQQLDAKPMVGAAAASALTGPSDAVDGLGILDADARHVGTRLPRAATAQREAQWAQLAALSRKMQALSLALATEARPLVERAAALDALFLAAARNAAAAEADVQAHAVAQRAAAACHVRLAALRAQCAQNDAAMQATISRVAAGLKIFMSSPPNSPRSVARAARLQDHLVEHVLRLAAKLVAAGSQVASPLAADAASFSTASSPRSPRAVGSSWSAAGVVALPPPLIVPEAAHAWLRMRIQSALAAHLPRHTLPSIASTPSTPRSSPRRNDGNHRNSAKAPSAASFNESEPQLTPQAIRAIALELLQVAGVPVTPRPAPPAGPCAPASPRGRGPRLVTLDTRGTTAAPAEQTASAPVVAPLSQGDLAEPGSSTPRRPVAVECALPPPSPRAAAVARGLAPLRSACGATQRELAARVRLDATNTALAADATAQRAEHAALAADFAASREAYRVALAAQIAQRAEERTQTQRMLRQQQAEAIASDLSLAQLAREQRDSRRIAARQEYREAAGATLSASIAARAATHGHQVSAHVPDGELAITRSVVDSSVRAGDADEAARRAAKRERNLAYGRELALSIEARRAAAAEARSAQIDAENDKLAQISAELAATRSARRAVLQQEVEARRAHIAGGIESPRQREARAWRAQDAESAAFAASARVDLDGELAATRAAKARRADDLDRNLTQQMLLGNAMRAEAHLTDERVAAQLVRTAQESLAREAAQRRADTTATQTALREYLRLQATERQASEAVAATEYDGWHKKTALAHTRGIGY